MNSCFWGLSLDQLASQLSPKESPPDTSQESSPISPHQLFPPFLWSSSLSSPQSSSSLPLVLSSLLQVSSSLLLVFSRLFLEIHVPSQGCSIFVTFYSPFLFFDCRPSWSSLVLVSLVSTCSGPCQSQWVSSGSPLVLPGLSWRTIEKRKKLLGVTLFETKT